jgi:porin
MNLNFTSAAFLLCGVLWLGASCACGQSAQNELNGPDKSEHPVETQQHLLGDWSGGRERLLDRGVRFDLIYVSDSLWNVHSQEKERLASWNRVRGTADVDFSKLTGTPGLTLHITGLWQGGGNMGTYLGTVAGPSGMASANTFRLDSWWLEKRVLNERLVVRAGQFAAQDFYGSQHFGSSFIFEPLGYAMGNLSATSETYDPPSTPAFEVRTIPVRYLYVKSMVFAADRFPYTHNPTGFVPQFRGAAMPVAEVGFTPTAKANEVRAQDNVESRRGYSGLYQLGAAYNPGKFQSTTSSHPVSGDYLIYGIANQAIYRRSPQMANGVDLTIGANWTPPDRTSVNQQLTAGLRVNEPLPIHTHNTFSIAYVRSGINKTFPTTSKERIVHKAEQAFEANMLVEMPHAILFQPVLQYFLNTGGSARTAVLVGFRTKVDF